MKAFLPEDLGGSARQRDVASLTRAVLATGLAPLEKANPDNIARRWNDRNVDIVLRAAVDPTALANTPALARISTAFLETLVPASAGSDLLARGIGLNFAGAAQINVPAIAVPVAGFVGEGKPIPVQTAPTSPGPMLRPHKLAVITVLTGTLMRSSNAEDLVKQALVESTGPALDAAMFSTNPASDDAPAGLLNGIAPLPPASNPNGTTESMLDDLQALLNAVAGVAGNGGVAIIAAPGQVVSLALRVPHPLAYPLLTSSSLANGTVIAVAPVAVVSAIEGTPEIRHSTQATLHRDTSPGQIVNGVMRTPVGSLYQTDQVALLLRWPISWGLRSSAGLAWMQSVNW